MEAELDGEAPSEKFVRTNYRIMEECIVKNQEEDKIIWDLMIDDEDNTSRELEDEQDTVIQYKQKWLDLEIQIGEFLNPPTQNTEVFQDNSYQKVSLGETRACRLPELELKKIDGTWLEWLGWWAQFSTIHEDARLSNVDKSQYLVQSMKENTRASRLVRSYPITADNYPKAIAALKDRFGDRVILTEVYVRQLLGLVVNNARRKTIGIEDLYDKLESYLRSLESLGITTEQNAAFLYPLVESSLPEELLTVCQRSALSGYNDEDEDAPQPVDGRLGSLLKFLRREVEGEKRLAYVRSGIGESSDSKSVRPNTTRLHVAEVNKPGERDMKACLFCRGDHWLTNCQKWLTISVQKRREVLMRHRACFKCFRVGHYGRQCWRDVECKICKKSHNTLLHLGERLMSNRGLSSSKENIHPKTESNAEKPDVSFAGMHVRTAVPTALLATALVRLVNHLNEEKVVRALLDQGSQSSFIHRDVLQGLSIPVSKVDAQIYGINATKGEEVKDLAHFAIRPIGNQNWELPLQALVVNKMTGLLPSRDLRLPITEKFRGIQLANPQFTKNGRIDIILGADVYGLLMQPEIRRDDKTQLCAQNTKLGWIISGGLSRGDAGNTQVLTTRVQFEDNLETILKIFWEVEEVQGHMTRLTEVPVDDQEGHCYLPYHAILGGQPDRRKFRVVFDASAKNKNGFSFNDRLYTGPKLQRDILSILMNCQRHRIFIMSDIEKMYRQILVRPSDAERQRIIWRRRSQDKLMAYRLNTVTYGTAAAPFLAMRTLLKLVEDEGAKYPRASRAIKEDTYVDYIITGADDLRDGMALRDELIELLRCGGFTLKKWSSNDPTILGNIAKEHCAQKIMFEQSKVIRTLGLGWIQSEDCFVYDVQSLEKTSVTTKREMLSFIAKLYDPLGWLAPVLVTGKIMVQRLWITGLHWDDPMDESLIETWTNFRKELNFIGSLRIHRWLGLERNTQGVQLHGFGDASEDAYAAAVYIRIPTDDGVSVKLLASKTKNLPTFIGNRVAEIQSCPQIREWRYVPTGDNPADIASRRILGSELKQSSIWWTGPTWLSAESTEWPRMPPVFEHQGQIELLGVHAISETPFLVAIGEMSSTFSGYIRKVAWILRFYHNCRYSAERYQSHLTTAELRNAHRIILQSIQFQHFREEVRGLTTLGSVKRTSKIYGLTPFLDNQGILRVGGRLKWAPSMTYEQKLSALLPSSGKVAQMIVQAVHMRTLHGSVHLMLSTLRQKYWMLRAKDQVKRCIRECVTCCRYNRFTQGQLMSDLPKERLTPGKPFSISGVDYDGPVNLRLSKGRGRKTEKGYICLFVCFVTRAVHLELVTDASTPTSMSAFKGFVARRGHCTRLYSDQGTNFVGAARQLRSRFYLDQNQLKELAAVLANDGTEWRFNPPGAPHFGGLWEAGVKALKYHMRRIIGNNLLTYEELLTVLVQIESCLNSIPLYPMSNDPNDHTRGHRKRRQFKQTDAFTKGMVIGLKRAGWSIRQIAADTYLGASTVHLLWRRWLEQGNVAINRNVGATRVTSARVDRRILRQAVAAPQATCTAILQHVQDTLDHSISTRTISRRLVANGLHSCRPLRRLPLTPPNRRQRLEWCRARSTWMTEWHRVVFSDESRFCLSSDSRRVRVWRRRGERSNPAAIVERPTVRQRGIMVWGAIAYDSRSPLLRIQGTMTAQRYVDDVLRPVTLPYLQGVPNALYQQDNARPHTARISQQALQDVQMLPWPPYSPDLSPIEHVWDIIGRRLHALPQPRSEDELWQMVEREWRAIHQDAIRTLIDSLPRRVAACIAVRGWHFIGETNAKIVWDELERIHTGNIEDNIIDIGLELKNIQMRNNEGIEAYITRARNIASRSANLGQPISQREMVYHVVRGLLPKFENIAAVLRPQRSASLKEVFQALQEEEMRLNSMAFPKVGQYEKAFKARNDRGIQRKCKFEGKCHTCGKFGHMSRNCWHRQDKANFNKPKCKYPQNNMQAKSSSSWKNNSSKHANVANGSANTEHTFTSAEIIYSSSHLPEEKEHIWNLDSGCTSHMSPREDWLINKIPIYSEINLAEEERFIKAEAQGDVKLSTYTSEGKQDICIKDVLYVPRLKFNLLSVRCLVNNGNKVYFEKGIAKIYNCKGDLIAEANEEYRMFIIKTLPRNLLSNKDNFLKAEDKCSAKTMWHRRLGHLNEEYLNKMMKNDMVKGLNFDCQHLKKCEPCILGKLTQNTFKAIKNNHSERPLELIHMGLCGPMPSKSLGGANYLYVIVDSYSRRIFVYFLKSKEDAFDFLVEFKNHRENETNVIIKNVRSDNGTEFANKKFNEFFRNEGIHHQRKVPYSPQSNGITERTKHTLLDWARTMLFDAKLPTEFWAETIATAAYLKNCTPTKNDNMKTPIEKWTGHKPSVAHLKIFGNLAYYYIPKNQRNKFDSKARKGIFTGYSRQRKAYRIYDPQDGKIHEVQTVKFDENSKGSDLLTSNVFDQHVQDHIIYRNEQHESDFFQITHTMGSTPEELNTPDNPETIPKSSRLPRKPGRIAGRTNEDIQAKHLINLQEQEERLRASGVRRSERIKERNAANVTELSSTSMNIPKAYREATNTPFSDQWKEAMEEEFHSLTSHNVWTLVPKPENENLIKGKWIFNIKMNPGGSIDKRKARFVAMGHNQKPGVDYEESFAPVMKLDYLRTLIAIASQQNMKIEQYDVKTAYLNAELKDDVYLEQPEGFVQAGQENKVCKLNRNASHSHEHQGQIELLGVHAISETPFLVAIGEMSSTFSGYIRKVAWILRFYHNCRYSAERYQSHLTTAELRNAHRIILQSIQFQHFREEVRGLTTLGSVKRTSKIYGLTPFLDNQGILRVGGRLKWAPSMTYEQKLSALLPSSGKVAQMIVQAVHMRTLHGSVHLMLSTLRQKYWMLRAKDQVKRCIRECVTCCRYNPFTQGQLMSDLPKERLTPGKPFSISGVDYDGPVNLRLSKGRGRKTEKGYICLFVCFVTRAVHLELVTDASTPTSMSAFKGFVARRGHCTRLYSDQGTNFVGAARQLRSRFYLDQNQLKELAAVLANDGTEWRFNPPGAPHFGGLWEAGVKALKYHMRRIIGNNLLTYEELLTVLVQIESCLNSIPLYPMSNDHTR
ncbi:hypothetical protein LAZ67_9001549, partial [Cordylochernes scorpioides]